jgi:formate hydrogenlyase subunit 6/NADH:ubiquinone oxidoreductase subunit I
MTIDRGRLHIDYRCCIGCFCCQELCPHGALQTRQGLLLRLGRYLQRR